jgi:hypothetical protein
MHDHSASLRHQLHFGRLPTQDPNDFPADQALTLPHLQGVTTRRKLCPNAAPAAQAFAVDEEVTPGDEGGPSNNYT